MRYWTSYSNPLDKTTDQRIKDNNYACIRELQTANGGSSHFSFGPLGWVIVDQAIANDKAERNARNMLRLCMESKGWREIDADDWKRIVKRLHKHPWANYSESQDVDALAACSRDTARGDADSPGKPLRLDWDRYAQCLTAHGHREIKPATPAQAACLHECTTPVSKTFNATEEMAVCTQACTAFPTPGDPRRVACLTPCTSPILAKHVGLGAAMRACWQQCVSSLRAGL